MCDELKEAINRRSIILSGLDTPVSVQQKEEQGDRRGESKTHT